MVLVLVFNFLKVFFIIIMVELMSMFIVIINFFKFIKFKVRLLSLIKINVMDKFKGKIIFIVMFVFKFFKNKKSVMMIKIMVLMSVLEMVVMVFCVNFE